MRRLILICATVPALAFAQTVAVDSSIKFQTIDGFGTCLGSSEPSNAWWQELYFDDLQASMVRVDLTPTFVSSDSANSYCSPWFGQAAPLRLDNGGNGPDGTRTRQYTGPADYSTSFAGCSAPIAVMGPDIDQNVKLLDFGPKATFGLVAQLGKAKTAQLGGFKLYGSMWSPAPWVKVSSGNTYGGSAWPLPSAGVSWPFIWGGNYAGGMLDVSGTLFPEFNDGVANTSALTQWSRGLAAFLRGFQNTYGVSFYAISIQNELNFEEFYNSATYPQASRYIVALKAARAELDKYPDLRGIRILGPEDLMGGDPYSLWQFGSGATATHKNLQYLQAVAADPVAAAAMSGFAIHGYAPDGIGSAGADPAQWNAWANGWTASPAAGIPAKVSGFKAFGKPSWMTETSGEKPEWLASSQSGGFPDQGAFSVALKLHQALTTGQQNAWLYWQITDGNPSDDAHTQSLTDSAQLAHGAKYVAAKHFFRYIRPGAQRVSATATGGILASAYALGGSLTVVVINENAAAANVSVAVPAGFESFDVFTSSSGSLWQASSLSGQDLSLALPGFGVATLHGAEVSTADAGTPDAGVADAGTSGGFDGGTTTGASPAATKTGCSSSGTDAFWLVAAAMMTVLFRRRPIAARRRARSAPARR